ncbi:MAG: zraR [Myxococcaceae bacterium]|nr:zraR [Myxococcaceae bacterium]
MKRTRHEARVLVLDDEPEACTIFDMILRGAGFTVETTTAPERALSCIERFEPDVLLTDVHLGSSSGYEVMERVHAMLPALPVVFVTGQANVNDAVRALRAGADHYLVKPVSGVELVDVVDRTLARRNPRGPDGAWVDDDASALVGDSAPMRALRAAVARVAPRLSTVLVRGETGSGKERVAEAIHAASRRAHGPFVRVHCAALPEALLESELFGHERGAFTGAHARRAGRFEQAHHGTLLLDEIGEISPLMQVKLLRVLQEHAFERVGSSETLRADVRVIAATHRDLWAMVHAGTFREDLYYRLNVLEVEVPPLRERRDDLAALVERTLRRLSAPDAPPRVTPEAMRRLGEHRWPGNVRELENVLERALVDSDGGDIAAGHIAPQRSPRASATSSSPVVPGATFAEIEQHAIEATLAACGGNITRAAEVLGLSPRTIHYRVREYRGEPGRRQGGRGHD